MSYHVYIMQSLKDGSYYIGSTSNLEDRIERHNQLVLLHTCGGLFLALVIREFTGTR